MEECHVESYKSIVDLRCGLKPGLNILIGKNGAGKTNFLRFLGKTLDWRSHFFADEKTALSFQVGEGKMKYVQPVSTSAEDDWQVEEGNLDIMDLVEFRFIPQRYDEKLPVLTHSIDFETSNVSEVYLSLRKGEIPWFIKSIFSELVLLASEKAREGANGDELRRFLEGAVKEIVRDLEVVSDFSPIAAVRLSDELRVSEGRLNNSLRVAGLNLEFQVGDRWFDFGDLSDGTQRIFLLVAEMELTPSVRSLRDKQGLLPEGVKETIFLIEEPELGVHPHQLHRIMEYLKERSADAQLVISTHSPMVLNFLDREELDRLLICMFDPAKGTQIRNLSPDEIKDALHYMGENELFLSDYWVYSDLEPEF